MNRPRLVRVVSRNRRISHDLYQGRLSRLFVVLDALAYTQIESSNGDRLKLQEEFGFEYAVDKRIWLLWRTHTDGKPVVFQSRGTDVSDHSNWDRPFGRDD